MGNVERTEQPSSLRIIKRYSNRKLYDTRASSYVTLLNISEMVRSGEQVQVIDNATKEDKTDVTLALIISEELKANPREIPVAALRALVRSRGGRLLHQLREGALGKLLGADEAREDSGPTREPTTLRPGEAEIDEESMEGESEARSGRGFRATLEQWHQLLDDRIRAVLPHWPGFQQMEARLSDLTRRVEQLERRVGSPAESTDPGHGSGRSADRLE
jgi:polyhydroxyalkanoate synthesis repressor PhaR